MRPGVPHSKPKPLALPARPPKGVLGKRTFEQFSQTIPLRSWAATLLHLAASAEYTPLARPYGVSLARATASSSVEKDRTQSTGPKNSSRQAWLSRGTSVRIVGGTKKPPLSRPGRASSGAWAVQPSARARPSMSRTLRCWPSDTTGPICVPSARGSPTRILAAAATSLSTRRGSMSRCTMSRLVAEQTWPVQEKMPTMTQSTTASRYSWASSKTTKADLPPSSSEVGRRRRAEASSILCPAMPLPVKETLSKSAWSMRAWPVLPPSASSWGGPPVITFRAPGGAPAAAASSPKAQQVKEARGDGFRTMAQPETSAGAIFRTACISG
mmetsp:Transcript_23625/g.55806  ORF Transcript_23625/g.55806 Transcript_23625/m.55806 type:complete len:327 (-) Transcript_23625:624-1604(-)